MIEFPVVNARDEVEAEAEAFPAATIALGKDAETLEGTDDVLHENTFA